MKKTYIIGEIGINHNGDLDIAKRLIDIATVSGCDAVKFQKRNPEVCVPEHQKNVLRSTPWGEMTYLEYKYRVEFEKEEYDIIDSYCKERNIHWSASPWDMDSLTFLEQYDIPFLKVPSAMLTNNELLEGCVATGKRIIFSTGMSTQLEIDEAVWCLRNAKTKYNNSHTLGLLHCNSTYPAPLKDLNLSAIKTLANQYSDFEIGYSGHEFRLGTSVAAVYLGASIIERHITLDRTMWGSDHMSSVEPQGLIKLVKGIRELEEAYGDGIIQVTESEKVVRDKLRG
jgi:N-acetylneuraminate synthase|tara:strand:+ start:2489 stop:3340 length:852 start_codon:yes stop_codon:yes gene_type:complete